MKKQLPVFLLLLLACVTTTHAQQTPESSITAADTNHIRKAILDYVEGVYTADTTRIHRSVHPTLVKRGTWYDNRSGGYVPLQEMSFRQLIELTKRWNRDGNRADGQSPRDIVIYDVQDKTATAKVTAAWGTDYFHLAKLEGRWYIMNVLWQSPPRYR